MSDGAEPLKFRHIAALDGLRGLAVVAVIMYHGTPLLKGGFIGVDIFFVLSGFLITSLLLKERTRHGRIDLKQFYMRRLLRLLPALVLMLAAFVLLATLVVTSPELLKAQLHSAGYALLYVSNWVRAFDIHDTDILVHTWSLSIEEQFYLLWPPLLLLCFRLTSGLRSIAAVLTVGVLGSSLWRAWLAGQGVMVERMYHGLDTRADGLLLGCLLAVWFGYARQSGRVKTIERVTSMLKVAGPLAAVALVIAAVVLRWRDPSMYFGVYFLVSLLATVLLAYVVLIPSSPLARVCEHPVLKWLGQRSYGLYLWHYPIFRILHEWFDLSWRGSVGAGLVLCLVITELSYHFWEMPMIRFKERFRPA